LLWRCAQRGVTTITDAESRVADEVYGGGTAFRPSTRPGAFGSIPNTHLCGSF